MAVGLGLENRAAQYLEKSAVLAATRLAHSDAAALFERAAALTAAGVERDRLLLRAARSYTTAGHYRQAQALGQAVATAGHREIRLEAAVAYEEASFLGVRAGRAVDLLGAALQDTSLAESDPLQVLGEAAHGRALVLAGHSSEGHAQLDKAVLRARSIADERLLLAVLTRCLTLIIKLAADGGFDRMHRQRDIADEVTTLAQRRGEFRPLGFASQTRAFAAYILGDPVELDTSPGGCSCRPAGSHRSRCSAGAGSC